MNNQIRYSILFIFVCGFNAISQTGCTDPNANNFNLNAVLNDGSCLYSITTVAPVLVCNLDNTLVEVSGIVEIDGKIWVHNDGGSSNQLHLIDTITGQIVHSTELTGISNIDWEEITQSASHVFIGDFGNNQGTRTNLKIYKILKADLTNLSNTNVIPEIIEFSYEDQVSFNSNDSTNFDCEAFYFKSDSLYLFSKNWGNGFTKRYSILAETGVFVANLLDSMNVSGLITGASFESISNTVSLLGYRKVGFGYTCFVWNLFDFLGNAVFDGNKREIMLGSAANVSQTEGIFLTAANRGWIVSEGFTVSSFVFPPKLMRFDWRTVFTLTSLEENASNSVSFFPNPVSGILTISGIDDEINVIQIFSSEFKLISDLVFEKTKNQLSIDFSRFEKGVYFVKINEKFERILVL